MMGFGNDECASCLEENRPDGGRGSGGFDSRDSSEGRRLLDEQDERREGGDRRGGPQGGDRRGPQGGDRDGNGNRPNRYAGNQARKEGTAEARKEGTGTATVTDPTA